MNYKDHPKSIAEVKADREQDGRLWKPRDALIDMLRNIDAGELDPKDIVIVHRGETGVDGQFETKYVCAGESGFTIAVGMLALAQNTMMNK